MCWLNSRTAWPRKRSCCCTEPKHSTTKNFNYIAAVNMGSSCERNLHCTIQQLLKWYPFTSIWYYRLTFRKQLLIVFFGAWLVWSSGWLPCSSTTEFENSSEFCSWKSCLMCVLGSAEAINVGCLATRKTSKCWNMSKEGQQSWSGGSGAQILWGAVGMFSLENRRFRMHFMALYNCSKGGCSVVGIDFSQLESSIKWCQVWWGVV